MCRHIARAILPNRSRSTILHSSKDLAVSPICLHMITPEGALAFRHRRHCSHLLGYPRQALPATLPLNCSRDKCSDFPLSTIINNMASDHSTRNPQTIQYFSIFSKYSYFIRLFIKNRWVIPNFTLIKNRSILIIGRIIKK